MTTLLRITKTASGLTPESRQALADWYGNLPEGVHEVRSKKISKTYLTRYKYYFGYLLPAIIEAGNFVEIDNQTGETWPMATETFHDFLKLHHNHALATDPFTGKITRIAASTTKLTDGEFIGQFEESISAHFQTLLGVELLSRSEWIDRKREELNPAKDAGNIPQNE